jgi:hypothetical protein
MMSMLPRRGLAIRGTAGVAALAVALAGCSGAPEPAARADDPSPQALPALPDASVDPAEAEAIEEILAAADGFREVEADLYADPPTPNIVRREFSRYLGDPMLSEIVGTLDDMRKAGVVFEGRAVSQPAVVEVDIDATAPTASVRDCVDATSWRPVFQETGDPVPGDSLPDRFVMTLEASLYPEHGWLFYDFAMEVDTQC